jgi:hypothetical protein
MAVVHGARSRAPVSVFAGLSTHVQLPPFRLTAGWRWPHREHSTMLKIVPDPPHTLQTLEDTLIQATDYALCAATVVHQAILLQPKSPASILMMASMHELETLRALLESAIVQVQMPTEPRTLH